MERPPPLSPPQQKEATRRRARGATSHGLGRQQDRSISTMPRHARCLNHILVARKPRTNRALVILAHAPSTSQRRDTLFPGIFHLVAVAEDFTTTLPRFPEWGICGVAQVEAE
jgi:hypothetical protein